MARLDSVALPSFGIEPKLPEIPLAEYRARLEALVAALPAEGLDVLAVYADREHSANLAFLTGFDPRFEEALLLLDAKGKRLLLVGNECMGYLPDAGLGLEVLRFQEFSLMGQSRAETPPLRRVLADFGITRGSRIGTVGWKYFESEVVGDPARAIEIPGYLDRKSVV